VENLKIKIWTIGHSTRSLDDFLALLKENNIRALADVRRFPGSRRHPHFGQDQLAGSLASEQIEYVHFPELGGRRNPLPDSANTAWRVPAFRGYADYMTTREFRAGIERLLNLAQNKPTAIMCAEALWWQCHRGLISDFLKSNGHEVLHIMGKNKIEPHPYTSAAQMLDGKLSYQKTDPQAQLI
jgi:uncharacterized protein (DUF488 family)